MTQPAASRSRELSPPIGSDFFQPSECTGKRMLPQNLQGPAQVRQHLGSGSWNLEQRHPQNLPNPLAHRTEIINSCHVTLFTFATICYSSNRNPIHHLILTQTGLGRWRGDAQS